MIVLIFITLAAAIDGMLAINSVNLTINPETVIRGNDVTMLCLGKLSPGEKLYRVQWYRGNMEFYRYNPGNIPPYFEFKAAGIRVDKAHSNESQVTLMAVDVFLAGSYKCEVSVDAPKFTTKYDVKNLTVIALPEKKPQLYTEKDSFKPNDIVRINCTSDESIPASELNLYINNHNLTSSQTRLFQSENGLQRSETIAAVKLLKDFFVEGKVKITCEAKIQNLYQVKVEKIIYDLTLDPIPEKITSSGAYSNLTPRLLHIMMIVFLVLTSFSRAGEFFDGENFYDYATMEYSDYANAAVEGHPLNSLTG